MMNQACERAPAAHQWTCSETLSTPLFALLKAPQWAPLVCGCISTTNSDSVAGGTVVHVRDTELIEISSLPVRVCGRKSSLLGLRSLK